jgi:hypothetical protein
VGLRAYPPQRGGARAIGMEGSAHGAEAILDWELDFGDTLVLLSNQDPGVGPRPESTPLPQVEESIIRGLPLGAQS